MTKSVLVALAIVSLAPAAARGATVIAPAGDAKTTDEGFSVSVLIDGSDHVLASVDDRAPDATDPFGGDTTSFAIGGIAVRQALSATRSTTAYGPADAAREPLPEPATWLMMILGFFGLSFAVRRRSVATGDRVRFS